ncbi:MAG TPA: 23S rRNA (uracil(1939)-C(5))-methyltransferase RlmD [Steroidobacteraceae bacterium]|nr:23S rRNA (uracil(1939)-C(5))-methyltransferase RlmD [Steroidobacteraceae bacterium]
MTESELGTVDALTHEGEGVVHGGKTVFVAGALPGELVRFRRARRRSRHDEAELIEVVRPSPERTEPRCAHFGICGGCALQHLAAERQIEAKQLELADSLARVARVEPQRWLEALRGPAWGYRRRARLGARYVVKKGRVLVGFRERLSPYVTATERCEVLAAPAGTLIGPLAELLTDLDVRVRVPQIEVAVGENATALVLRVLAEPTAADLEKLERFEHAHRVRLYLQRGGLDSVTRLSTGRDAHRAECGSEEAPLAYRLEEFGVRIEFAPTDFVQVNGPVNAALVNRAVSLLDVTSASRVLDLYCGLGNFTLPLARRAAEVLGVEGDSGLVERARHNARLNGIANASFIAADLAQPLEDLPWLAGRFSHVLLDPPRAGARDVMRTIARIAPEKVLYISCHPGSLARDVGVMVHEHGFSLEAAGVVDMFPHTTHVESLALLTPGR